MQKSLGTARTVDAVTIEIGGMPIGVRTDSSEFARLLQERYGSFGVGAGSGRRTGRGVAIADDEGGDRGSSNST